MPEQTRIAQPGPRPRTIQTEDGQVIAVPKTWELLKPGDAGATRRVKAAGPTWTIKQKRGRRTISLGVWADRETIASIAKGLVAERSTDAYAKRQKSAAARREKVQHEYVGEFTDAVESFLNFHPRYRQLAVDLAVVVAAHATPVGSGTVARTKRIPVEQRAQSAVIAWMRHQTTAYDNMVIPRVKGKRREVRRMLAAKSRELLEVYRQGVIVETDQCLLQRALGQN